MIPAGLTEQEERRRATNCGHREALLEQAVRNILSKVNGATKRWEPIFIAGLCSEGIRAEFRRLDTEQHDRP